MSAVHRLDRRHAGLRMLEWLWSRGEPSPGLLLRMAAQCTAPLLRWFLARRLEARGQPPARPFILSVGNLRVGGTGKTPLVIALARELAGRGIVGVVLTRGYGSRCSGPLWVTPDDPRAGDEARLMATSVPSWPVCQARDRRAGLAFVLRQQPLARVVILEDGHQTAGVPRHLDVLILDRWRQEENNVLPGTGLTLPWGPYREPASGAARAGVWLIEDSNSPAGVLRGTAGGVQVPVIPFRRRLSLPEAGSLAAQVPWAAVSGLARPEAFEVACQELLGRRPVLIVRHDDHHRYREADVSELVAAGRKRGAGLWLTTGKDWLKLAPLWPAEEKILQVGLEVEWSGNQTLPDLVEERLAEGGSEQSLPPLVPSWPRRPRRRN